ncbi:MAG: recombinase family protein [Bacteroides intestinalis]|nr:recombinase family protein [Bacteroides intestinalis]
MMKIIGYARVSTTKQDLSRQKLKIKEFCENNNYELTEIIEDFGISGTIADRKGYLELQSKTYKDADMIVISELSRLSRQEDVTETVYNIQQIINRGLSVTLLDSPNKIYEASKLLDITEILILTIKAWAAAQERLEIKKKNQDGKQALFQEYPYAVVDQKIPYGYRQIPNPNGKRPRYILEEVPEEVEKIKKLFSLVIAGKTLGAIARYFNERDITFRGYYSTVAILSNYIHSDIYRGIRRRTQKLGREEPYTVEVKIKPIISEEDFFKAQELIKINCKNTPTGKINHNPLKGIIKCRCDF